MSGRRMEIGPMASSATLRAKARGYLKQAQACRDEMFAGELRNLARQLSADAARLEADGPADLRAAE
jgi:hypothetical protein